MQKECKDCECYKCKNKENCFECRSCVQKANYTSETKTKCMDRQVRNRE